MLTPSLFVDKLDVSFNSDDIQEDSKCLKFYTGFLEIICQPQMETDGQISAFSDIDLHHLARKCQPSKT